MSTDHPGVQSVGGWLLQQMLDEVDAGVIATDLDYRVLFWSRGAEELYGWTAAEASGRTTLELLAPELSELDIPRLRAGALAGPRESERALTRKDGSEIVVLTRLALILDGGGEPQGFVGVSVDITERRATEERLRETTEFLHALTDSMGEGQRSADEMIVNADLAMYDAKDQGRDGWAEYASDKYDEPRSKARITWINRIEAALDDDRFQLHAQPVVDLTTGETVQLEVLLRLSGEDGELIPPATFLYIAERHGLAPRIDRWVLNEVFGVLESTERDALPVSLAANISGPSLNDPAVIDDLQKRIRARTFTPERLVLEVTETAAIANVAAARAFADALRTLGCRFALDDFGAGFASFYYLKHLPFDFVKIDGEFVANCLDDPVDQAIIGSLVDLARSLGKETIAEHVPNDRTRRFLRQRGVDHGQGHHLGRPVPLHAALLNAMTDERGLERTRRLDQAHEHWGRTTPSQYD